MLSKRQKQKREEFKRQIYIIIMALCVAGLVINCYSIRLGQEIAKINTNQAVIVRAEVKPETLKEEIEQVEEAEVAGMELAIRNASKEFNVPEWLIIGIANAESGMGKYFAVDYDRDNCNNWWGLKGGNMAKRDDGSYLRCFVSPEAGARTVAKTLRNYYLDEGKDTPEEICQKWIGGKFANKVESNGKTHCQNWVNNVIKYKK